MAEEQRVSRASFKGLTQPKSWASLLPPERVWSNDDWDRICCGRAVREQEDKWIAFVERDHLFLHRIATGGAIYDALFEAVPAGWHIKEAWVADDPAVFLCRGDEHDSLLLEALIEELLLGRPSDYAERLSRLRGPEAQAKGPIYKRTWVIVTAAMLLVLVIIGITIRSKKATKVTGGQSSATTAALASPAPATAAPATPAPGTPTPAQQGNAALDAAAQRVHAIVVVVLVTLGSATRDQTPDSVKQLAIAAQNAHDNLDAIKSSDAGVFSNSGDAGYEMFGALNDLKNSMGALVAYTGDPNPATLAQFNSQWQAAVSRWNDGVFKVYAGSTLTAPTIPTA